MEVILKNTNFDDLHFEYNQRLIARCQIDRINNNIPERLKAI